MFDWTDAGAANPNYASTPYNPSIQVNTVVWDADVQKYVAFYKSTAWSGVAYYLDVVVVLNGAGTTATEIYLGLGPADIACHLMRNWPLSSSSSPSSSSPPHHFLRLLLLNITYVIQFQKQTFTCVFMTWRGMSSRPYHRAPQRQGGSRLRRCGGRGVIRLRQGSGGRHRRRLAAGHRHAGQRRRQGCHST